MERAAIYLRSKTNDPEELKSQRTACQVAAKRIGVQITREYTDIGEVSGRLKDRPALQELLRHDSDKQIDFVIVDKLSTFTLNWKLALKIIDELNSANTLWIPADYSKYLLPRSGR